jgi:hypothetical protein
VNEFVVFLGLKNKYNAHQHVRKIQKTQQKHFRETPKQKYGRMWRKGSCCHSTAMRPGTFRLQQCGEHLWASSLGRAFLISPLPATVAFRGFCSSAASGTCFDFEHINMKNVCGLNLLFFQILSR